MPEGELVTSAVVHQWQCDHLGHLNTRHYAAFFDDALFVFWGRLGIGVAMRERGGPVPVTAEMKMLFRSEAVAGMVLTINGRISRVGTKSVAVVLEMVDADSGRTIATCDAVEVFFDTQARVSRSIPEVMRERLVEAS